MTRIYSLKVNYSQNVDDFPNIHKVNSEDYQDLSQLLASEKYSFNENIIARGNINILPNIDFVSNDITIPILSRRIIEEISLDQAKHLQLVSLLIVDDTYLESFSKNDVLDKKVPIYEGFYSLNFTKQMDFCNHKLSEFRTLRSKPNELGILKRPVLNIPNTGFPDVFRIKESVSYLFVSDSFKAGVENKNMKGFIFEEIEIN